MVIALDTWRALDTPKYGAILLLLLLDGITNEKTVKLIQLDTMPALTPDPALAGSNNSDEHIPY